MNSKYFANARSNSGYLFVALIIVGSICVCQMDDKETATGSTLKFRWRVASITQFHVKNEFKLQFLVDWFGPINACNIPSKLWRHTCSLHTAPKPCMLACYLQSLCRKVRVILSSWYVYNIVRCYTAQHRPGIPNKRDSET